MSNPNSLMDPPPSSRKQEGKSDPAPRNLETCPVCGSGKIRPLYVGRTTRPIDARTWQVDACGDCGHGFMNPQPSWDELAPYYSPDYQAYDPAHGADGSDDEVVARAKACGEFRHVRINPGDRVLDVGCGAGFFLRIARRLGAEVQGVEPGAVASERARASGLPVFHGTLAEYLLQDPESRFELITANHVLEHVPDPVEVLAAMGRLVAPGGRIWIAVPNADCAASRALRGLWHSADLPFHLMQFSPASLALAGERAGLVVDSLSTYSLPSAAAATIRQVLRHRYLIPRRLTAAIGVIDTRLAPRHSRRIDAEGRGEAVLVTFRTPAPKPTRGVTEGPV